VELGAGILGFGFMGRMHAFCHAAIPHYYDPPPARTRLVAVATSREETARAALGAGFEFATTDWREVVERPGVDIVHICTPNALHAEQAIAALEAGRHVYCDKPLAATLEDAERIRDAAARSRGRFQVVFQYRFLPAVIRAKELVDEGFLGRVLRFRAEYLHSGYADPSRPMSWRLDRTLSGGGALYDLGSHVTDLMLYLLGPFASVSAALETFVKERPDARGRAVRVEVDDAAYLTVRTRLGAVGTIEASRVATGSADDLRFEISGERGAIRFSLMEPSWLEACDLSLPDTPHGGRRGYTRIECAQRYPGARLPSPRCAIGWERAHVECLAAFLRSIASLGAPRPSAEDGLEVQRVLDAAQKSAASGRWVDL